MHAFEVTEFLDPINLLPFDGSQVLWHNAKTIHERSLHLYGVSNLHSGDSFLDGFRLSLIW